SVMARGYSMMTLAFLLLLIVGARLQEHESVEGWILFAIVAALGLWTIPVMLFPLGTAALWLAGSSAARRRWTEVRNLGLALVLAGAVTALLYLPVVMHEGVHAITSNQFVAPSTWQQFIGEMVVNGVDIMRYWTFGMPGLLALTLGACAIIGVRWHDDVSRRSFDVPFAALVWCSLFLMLNPRAPAPRMWQWLIPIAAGAAGAGLVWLLERSPRMDAFQRRIEHIAVGFALVTGVLLLLPQ
ncbi:MAG TPA: hypothetical protein VFT29_03100, partial [Gemmatimonadaceae bacterium]|nr:hypothetical protein [Gemmatimonadaceae bacterium]